MTDRSRLRFSKLPERRNPQNGPLRSNGAICRVNEQKTDQFMEALLAAAPTWPGFLCAGGRLPDAPDWNGYFAGEIRRVRFKEEGVPAESDPVAFWEQYQARCTEADKADRLLGEAAVPVGRMCPAQVAALMQILGPEEGVKRLGLVKYLASVSHADATRALARLVRSPPTRRSGKRSWRHCTFAGSGITPTFLFSGLASEQTYISRPRPKISDGQPFSCSRGATRVQESRTTDGAVRVIIC